MTDGSTIDQYFELALDLPERKRARLLAKLAAEDPETAAAVTSLLRGHVRNADFVCQAGTGGRRDNRAAGVALGIDQRAARTQLDPLHHVAIPVDDIGRAVDWYRHHFRCEVDHQDDTWAVLRFANARLSLVRPDSHPAHVAIARSDAAAFGALQPHRDGTRSAYITDPFGNSVEVLDRRSLPS